MPLPSPRGSQDHDSFISSCMANDVMNREFPKNAQRFKVCESQWDRAKKRKRAKSEDGAPTWDEAAADIAENHCIVSDGEVRILAPKGADKA